jgi:putative endonuclease
LASPIPYNDEFGSINTRNIDHAIAREKEIKGWRRQKKIDLIEHENSTWQDLSAAWFDERLDSSLRSE